MKIVELKGKDIMKAYDGNYLSSDFGYSCANFNVENSFGGWGENNWNFFESYGGHENDETTFDFYTKNIKNVSCFVCYNDQGKICGRRMFFTGPSMINEKEFEVPMKKGYPINYLYGYYGSRNNMPFEMITKVAIKKYGGNILYTDSVVLERGSPNHQITNLWVMSVEKTDFIKYPPIDLLYVSTQINALANFNPRKYVLDVLEKDFRKKNIEFNQAYRFRPSREKKVRYDYKTWADHHGVINSEDDYTKEIQEEE